ncbi:origin of replication complex subunit 5-like [Olea europaea var. sylvestris]|uniref:Origin of replication complex subunit 5 n=1 Tax=Olea europaea subsp. europaea TaxID=158383 RepID=A0A8S0UJY8_OLEEU|nr:origin of replication complex subunit 5-like [Olea europaea var. sylvestris]CAA3017925.1 origin of replication complex subunit 5 [Olea europaea subsp. europaea]
MGKEESPHVNRRTTRSSSSTTPNSKTVGEVSKIISNTQSLTVNDLVISDESISLEELINSFPHRRVQILELIKLLGPLNSPMIPLFVYGGASTGKTSTVLEIFKHLKRPFIYSSCITCYNPRILFESILNQLLLHRKNERNGYSSAKRCEKPSDFVNLLHDALSTFIDRLEGDLWKSNSKKSPSQVTGKMIYLIIDNLEHVREWDKSLNILPFLFNLYDILKMPEMGLIFISKTSLDTYHSDTGYAESLPVYFPDYTEDDLRKIFMKDQSNPKLYSSFLDVVLRPFYHTTRRVDDVTNAISPLYKKYCEPLDDTGITPDEDTKRKLFKHINPYISQFLKETFQVPSQPTLKASASKDKTRKKGITKPGFWESLDELDFHMSTCAKYLLISAFLASRNPATLDASLFDSTGGSGNRKRKRKSSEKSMEKKESKEQELLMKGPGTFPLERLLAIFQCISSVAEYSPGDEVPQIDGLGANGWDSGLMSDVLLQLSSLCSANFITKGGSCPLEGAIRYRSAVSEDMALKVARSLKFPLPKYLYSR